MENGRRGFNPGVLNIGDIDKTEGCKKAADLANAI